MNLRDTYTSTIQKGDVEEPLLFHDKHEALVLLQDHKLNFLWLRYLQSKLSRNTTTVYYTAGDGEVHEQAGEAQLPKSSKPPQLPKRPLDFQTRYLQQETQHTKDNKSRSGLLRTDSPRAHYKPTHKQQYYN